MTGQPRQDSHEMIAMTGYPWQDILAVCPTPVGGIDVLTVQYLDPLRALNTRGGNSIQEKDPSWDQAAYFPPVGMVALLIGQLQMLRLVFP